MLVAIADVDAVVRKRSAIEEHARHNTTSVYTAAKIFPMLPGEALDRSHLAGLWQPIGWRSSSRWSSPRTGSVADFGIYRARVRNQAKLAYNSVAAWLEGGPMPPALGGRRRDWMKTCACKTASRRS